MTTVPLEISAASFIGADFCRTILDSLTPVAHEYGDRYDWPAVEADYRAELDKLLPDGYAIAGECVYRDFDRQPLAEEEYEGFLSAVAAIDLDPIMAAHENQRLTVTRWDPADGFVTVPAPVLGADAARRVAEAAYVHGDSHAADLVGARVFQFIWDFSGDPDILTIDVRTVDGDEITGLGLAWVDSTEDHEPYAEAEAPWVALLGVKPDAS